MAAPSMLFSPSPLAVPTVPTAHAAAGPRVSTATFTVNRDARRWFTLAIASLVIAGLLSLSVVIGRLPGIAPFIDDPLLFKRCLVVHVDLALVVWFYAFLAGLATLRTGVAASPFARGAFYLSVAGVIGMLAGALMRGAQPVLANYVPVIDHPLFLGGLAAFFVGTLVYLIETLAHRTRSATGGLPVDAAIGLQAAVIAVVLAGATWISTRAALPAGLDAWTRYEFSAWGAGHVLQVANATAMVAVWLWLLARATGQPVLSARGARIAFAALLAPHFAMPLLTARGALDPLYHTGATQLMRWGIFPVVLTIVFLSLRHLWQHGAIESASARLSAQKDCGLKRALPSASDSLARIARAGFFASAGLTTLGFVLGGCIRSSTTLVPAHYHASLGGVTVAFMAAAYVVCAAIAQASSAGATALRSPPSFAARRRNASASPLRTAARQLTLFGIGQAVFALGFAIGGHYGLGRKAYAGEQHIRSGGELIGLGVMGLGGLVATIAGIWFLALVLREMRHGWFRGPRVSTISSPTHSSPMP